MKDRHDKTRVRATFLISLVHLIYTHSHNAPREGTSYARMSERNRINRRAWIVEWLCVGPLIELDFWSSKMKNLEGIQDQLTSDAVQQIKDVLAITVKVQVDRKWEVALP